MKQLPNKKYSTNDNNANSDSNSSNNNLQKEQELSINQPTQSRNQLKVQQNNAQGTLSEPTTASQMNFNANNLNSPLKPLDNDSPQPLSQNPKYNLQGQQMLQLNQANQVQQKPRAAWQKAWHYKFIQYWQTIFNRRIASFSCFALQIGDVVIFAAVVGFLVFCCLKETKQNNSGTMAEMMMGATVVFGCRNGILSYVFGLSIERAVIWHQLMAWITLGLSINHWHHSRSITSGYMVIGPLFAFLFFSLPPIRRHLWELFMRMHWILIIILIIGCIAHGVTVTVITIIYFFIDFGYRMYTAYMNRHSSKEMKLEKVGSNITKVSMKNIDCQYKGGQYFFMMIPKLSYLQWHPFSVFSASYESEIVFYIKSLGDWTSELYKLAGNPGNPTTLTGYIDGPYGSHSISIEGDKYQNFLMISGGIGVTPIISTAKEVLAQMDDGRPVKSLHFIWTGRDSAIVERVFSPDDLRSLISQDNTDILQTFYHFSNVGDKKLADIEAEAKQNHQPLIDLAKGRPNFEQYFEAAFKCAKESGQTLVGVLTCGPQSLIDTVEQSAMKWSKEGIRFDVHQEVFNF